MMTFCPTIQIYDLAGLVSGVHRDAQGARCQRAGFAQRLGTRTRNRAVLGSTPGSDRSLFDAFSLVFRTCLGHVLDMFGMAVGCNLMHFRKVFGHVLDMPGKFHRLKSAT